MSLKSRIGTFIRALGSVLRNPSSDISRAFSGGSTRSGVSVSEFSALQLSVVWACIKIISEDTASLPLILYKKRKSGGKDRATDDPRYYMMHDQPNPEMTAMSFREAYAAHLLSWGNAYAEKQMVGNGKPIAIWPITPNRCTPYREQGTRQIRYTISLDDGGTADLPKSQIIHTPGPGFNGLFGYSPIGMARETIGMGLALEEYGQLYFGNGIHPSFIVSSTTTIKDPRARREALEEVYGGLGRAHRVMLLEEAEKIEKIGIPNDEAQFLETRKFQNIDIGTRIYRLPPHMYGEFDKSSTYASAEQFSIDYVTKTLRAWLVRLEQSYNSNLLTPAEQGTYFFEHLVDGLLRGDIKSRFEAYSVAKSARIFTTNEIREMENRNPIEGGDVLDETPNMLPPGKGGNQ